MDKYKNKDGISLSYDTNSVNIENSDNKINYNPNVHTELVQEVISESIKILNMCDKNCKISMGISMSNTKKFLTTNFSIEK
jgi:hypothetical protein